MKNLIIAFALLTIALMGCKVKKEFVYLPGETVHTTDTVTKTVTVIVRDTVIKKEESKASASVPLKDVKKGFKHDFKNKDASGSIEEKDGNLNVTCKCDSLEIRVKLQDKIIETLKKKVTEKTTPRPVQYIPWYIKILAWVGGIFLAFAIIMVLAKKFKIIK